MRNPCALALLVAVAACSSADPATTSTAASAGSGTASFCAKDRRAEPYAVGLSATSANGGVKITFEDAQPAPPARGDNTWVVTLTGASGPMSGASVDVKPYMPDHAHGPSVMPTVTAMGGGAYQVTHVDLFMPGVWQVTFTATAGGKTESVVFTFCVEG